MSELRQTILQVFNVSGLIFKLVNTYSLIPKMANVGVMASRVLSIVSSIGIHILLLDFYLQLK
jgi:hypothetical protein